MKKMKKLKAKRKRDLLSKAEQLAGDLARGGATRSEWRHVLDGLYLAPGEPDQRRVSTRALIKALPQSGLEGRSKQTKRKLSHVGSVFHRVIQENYSDMEMRFLLGWTTRILYANEKDPKPPPPREPTQEVWCAVSADQLTAEARQEAARKLMDELNEEIRTKLRRRSIRAAADVEKVGLAWRLVAVRVKS